MFQNAKNRKSLIRVADTIQTLVEIGIKPEAIHFDERKIKVTLSSAPVAHGLGASYCYSWGKDSLGKYYEMHMLPMRDVNLVWKTYPKRQSIRHAQASRQPLSNQRREKQPIATVAAKSTDSKRAMGRLNNALRLNKHIAQDDNFSFEIA